MEWSLKKFKIQKYGIIFKQFLYGPNWSLKLGSGYCHTEPVQRNVNFLKRSFSLYFCKNTALFPKIAGATSLQIFCALTIGLFMT